MTPLSGAAPTGCRLPFLGKILRFSPHRFVEVERWLTREEDLYLADHRFPSLPGEVSGGDSLPILPLAMSVEAMAEAAACLAPGLGWVGFRGIRASRSIGVEEPVRLLLRAERSAPEPGGMPIEIAISLFREGQKEAACSGFALFSDRYVPRIAFGSGAIETGAGPRLTGEDAYERGFLFHGPSLRCLRGPLFLGRKSALGHFVVRPRRELFRSQSDPELLSDPRLLDGIAQLVALWGGQSGRIVVPTGFSRLEVFGPPPLPGERLAARIAIVKEEGPILLANAELVDSRARAWLRVEGWRGWWLRLRESPAAFLHPSSSRRLGEPIELSGRSSRTVAVLLRSTSWGDLSPDFLARSRLHPRELAQWERFGGESQRRREWLLGRLALKEALRLFLGSRNPGSGSPDPRALAVVGESGSAPRLRDPSLSPSAHLSLAHTADLALGAVSEAPIGVDLETVRKPADALWDALREAERREISSFSAADGQEGFFRLWCAKEAAGKLFGSGLDRGPSSLEARWRGEGEFLVRHRGTGRSALVRTMLREGSVLAWTR